MKKVFLLLLFLSGTSWVLGQASRWFVTVSAGPGFGGPAAGIKKNMERCGFNDKSAWSIMGISGTNDYPYISKGVPVLVTGGKRLKDHKSIYITAGVTGSGTVTGRNRIGSYDYVLFSGNYGNRVTIDYQVWQLTAGYQYSYPGTRVKLGFGPTALLFRYREQEEGTQYSKPAPAVSGMMRVPFGRERKLFGMELFVQGVLAPPVKTREYTRSFEENGQKYMATLEKANVSLCQLMAGISFTLRDVISNKSLEK